MRFYQWSRTAARYRDPGTGHFVSRETIRYGLDDLIRVSQNTITVASDDVRNGKIDLPEWHFVMREEIKRTQLGAEALLRGGWDQMSQADYGRVGQRVREQYGYLAQFTSDLQAGVVKTDGRFITRARMYAAAARVGYQEGQAEQVREIGYTEELNVLHPAEHCLDCLEATDNGWVPIGQNVPIGNRECLGNDRCTMRYR